MVRERESSSQLWCETQHACIWILSVLAGAVLPFRYTIALKSNCSGCSSSLTHMTQKLAHNRRCQTGWRIKIVSCQSSNATIDSAMVSASAFTTLGVIQGKLPRIFDLFVCVFVSVQYINA